MESRYVAPMILVTKTKETTYSEIVSILHHKLSGKFSFVNLSKGHICPCEFNTIEEAWADLENQKKNGKVNDYKIIPITFDISF